MEKHPGITMHKFTVGGGFIGLLFAVGCSVIFVLGLPALWYFLALSAGLGLGIAFLLRVVNRHRSERSKPLSIFVAAEKNDPHVDKENAKGNQFHVQAAPCLP